MKEQTSWVESKSKERASQNFVKTILELAGYKVMDYGIEHHNIDIVKEIKTSYKTKTNVRLLSMPDFVVLNPETKESELVEIKFRTTESFDWRNSTFLFGYRSISNLIEYWKDATLIIVMDVKPYCLCVKVSDIDWNLHFREKIETAKGRHDEVWNFSGRYRFISKMFTRVSDEHFSKALRLAHLKEEPKEDKKK